MTEDDTVSSFDESGYFFGPLQFVSAGGLEQETKEWYTEAESWPAEMRHRSAPPASLILMTILQEAVLAKAAFIHIAPRRYEYLVRYRVGNKLWEANAFPAQKCAALYARFKRMSGVNIAERRVPQFGRFLYWSAFSLHEMRLSSIPIQQGEAFVINVLPYVGKGDYTAKRHEWLDQLTAEDVLAQIHEMQKGTTE